MLDKTLILQAITATLTAQLHETVLALQTAHAGATNAESRPENKYDTRALETSYMAAAHTERAEALRRVMAQVHFWRPESPMQVVAPGALVELEGERAPPLVFLVPFTASMTVTVNGRAIQVVSTAAPLAAALLGTQAGDLATVRVAGQMHDVEIVAVDPPL
jgi:transcription elongation GreA/GreB family factor